MRLRSKLAFSFLGLIALTAAASAKAAKLTVGSDAPSLTIAKWVKGTPVNTFEKGKVYVVEFWATWCVPCRQSIPHLTELAKKYDGKASFVGVSIWEKPEAADDSYIADVEKYVTEMGAKMDYSIGADGHEGKTADTWATAAHIPGIPTAFIVNQEGKIAWIGHPMAGLDAALMQVTSGTWDMAKAAEEQAKADRRQAEQEKAEAAMADADKSIDEIRKQLQSGQSDGAWAKMDALIQKYPDFRLELESQKFELLLTYKESDAYAYAETISSGDYHDEPMALNTLAWRIASAKDLKTPNYKLAVKLAQRASSILKDENPEVLDTLGLSLYLDRQFDKAIEVETKALKLAEADKGFEEITKKEMAARLAIFKKKGKSA